MPLPTICLKPKKKLGYDYHRRTLPSGLTLVEVHQPHLHRGSIAVFLRAGSRYETEEKNGLTHFLEHMLFRGTENLRSAYELNLAIERLGGTLYAATSPDSIEFELTLPTECLTKGVSLLAEILTQPIFRHLEIERRVVTEEIKEELDEHGRPIDVDYLSRRRLWSEHPLGRSVTGSLANIHRFTEDDLREHFRNSVVAKNAVVCLTGAFDHSELAPCIEEEFSKLPQVRSRILFPPPKCSPGPTIDHAHRPGSQTQLRVAFAGLSGNDPDRVALGVLLGVLDDGMSTRLHRRIFDELGLAYDVSADVELYADTGAFNIDLTTSHDNAVEAAKRIGELTFDLREGAFEPGELAKAKKRETWALISYLDSPHAMSAWFGEQELHFHPISLEERMSKVEQVEPGDLKRVANRIFTRENLHITTVGMLGDNAREALEQAMRGSF